MHADRRHIVPACLLIGRPTSGTCLPSGRNLSSVVLVGHRLDAKDAFALGRSSGHLPQCILDRQIYVGLSTAVLPFGRAPLCRLRTRHERPAEHRPLYRAKRREVRAISSQTTNCGNPRDYSISQTARKDDRLAHRLALGGGTTAQEDLNRVPCRSHRFETSAISDRHAMLALPPLPPSGNRNTATPRVCSPHHPASETNLQRPGAWGPLPDFDRESGGCITSCLVPVMLVRLNGPLQLWPGPARYIVRASLASANQFPTSPLMP